MVLSIVSVLILSLEGLSLYPEKDEGKSCSSLGKYNHVPTVIGST